MNTPEVIDTLDLKWSPSLGGQCSSFAKCSEDAEQTSWLVRHVKGLRSCHCQKVSENRHQKSGMVAFDEEIFGPVISIVEAPAVAGAYSRKDSVWNAIYACYLAEERQA